MSRIRSIHPGFFTDEDLVSVSMAARLLFLGLGVEADDKGIFEWKPLTIKMRLFPADPVDVPELLAELESANAIRSYELDGRKYGAIRNFRHFQRPRKPNNIHPMPPEFGTYVGMGTPSSELVGNQFGTGGENAPQMEDGGEDGVGEEGKEKKVYVFCSGDVRLNRRDYDEWRKRFHAIPDIDAELATLAVWLAKQTEAKRKDWFATGASWLNRRHQEALGATAKARDEMPIC